MSDFSIGRVTLAYNKGNDLKIGGLTLGKGE